MDDDDEYIIIYFDFNEGWILPESWKHRFCVWCPADLTGRNGRMILCPRCQKIWRKKYKALKEKSHYDEKNSEGYERRKKRRKFQMTRPGMGSFVEHKNAMLDETPDEPPEIPSKTKWENWEDCYDYIKLIEATGEKDRLRAFVQKSNIL